MVDSSNLSRGKIGLITIHGALLDMFNQNCKHN